MMELAPADPADSIFHVLVAADIPSPETLTSCNIGWSKLRILIITLGVSMASPKESAYEIFL
jgi:hypothetical protein